MADRADPPAVLTISLDTELAWGRIARTDLEEHLPEIRRVRAVVARLLELFEEHQTAATWAVVGALMEEASKGGRGDGVPDLGDFHPGLRWSDVETRPELRPPEGSLLHWPELVERISESTVKHEIASHTYSHLECTADAVRSGAFRKDLEAFRRVAAARSLDPTSFVFPRDQIGGTELLPDYGFHCYRTPQEAWFGEWWKPLRAVARRLDLWLAFTPSVGRCRTGAQGLVEIPTHLLLRFPRRGLQSHLPTAILRRKALRGLDRAVRRGALFHVWFHPFNFAFREEDHIELLDRLLRAAAEYRRRGRLEVLTMGELARRHAGGRPTAAT